MALEKKPSSGQVYLFYLFVNVLRFEIHPFFDLYYILSEIISFQPKMGKKSKKDFEETPEEEELGEEEYTVEKVVDSRMRGGRREYLLKWKGYPE